MPNNDKTNKGALLISKQLDNYFSPEDVQLVKETVAKGTTSTELAYFLNVAKSVGLSPFNKEIWCYKDNKDNLIIFTGRDGLLKKAQENPNFNGIRSAEIKEKDEFSIDIANNQITHKITTAERGKIIGAYALVFRKGGEPTVSYVEFSRYNKKHFTWSSHPEDMIKKVAESKALKLAFGISGLQIEDDFEINNGVANELQPKREKTVVADEIFNKMMSNSDDYIEKIKDKVELTEKQKEIIEKRLGGQQ